MLASGSPRRAEILGAAGFELAIVPADVDEDGILAARGGLEDAVEALALVKASAVAAGVPGSFVLGADTIVVIDGEILGKPVTAKEATEMLRRLNDRAHQVITAVAVVNPSGESHTAHVSTSVIFRRLDEEAITEYVSSGSPFDKAGGYGIQDRSFSPVASYDECYLNVVGLPMCATSELLDNSGFPLAGAIYCAGHAGTGQVSGSGESISANEPESL